jgi:hypothetical protein
MQRYDLILILGFFRRLTCYLNIIEYLGKDFRIGLFPVPLDESLKSKHKTAQEDFVRTSINMGAQLVDGPVSAKVALFPQEPYLKEAVELIHKNLTSSRKLAVMSLAWAGLQDAFIKEFDIPKVLVIHKAFFEFLLQHRGDPKVFEGREIIETGLPYKKYPVFPDFQTDYLLAIPTPFSFPHEKDKWHFLKTVLDLFKKISPGDKVVLKPHNAMDHDYFSDREYRNIVQSFSVLPEVVIRGLLKSLAVVPVSKIKSYAEKLYTAYLYEKVMDRVIRMEEETPHHYLSFEAFLPGVRKGVIGGLSNTIWGTLFHKLPFYNCVDIERQNRQAENTLYKKDPSQFLDLNLKFFNVPYCKGRLEFDPKYFDIIDDSARQGDLIETLKQEISLAVSEREKLLCKKNA